MKKILHLVRDDEKFFGIVKRLFDKQGVENTYFVEVLKRDVEKAVVKNNVKYTRFNAIFKKLLQKELLKYDLIIIHYLSRNKAKLIAKSKIDKSIVWCSWGRDFYQAQPKLSNNLFDDKTLKVSESNLTFKIRIKKILAFLYIYKDEYFWQKKAIRKINYVAPVIYNDYELITKIYNAPHLRFVGFSYGNLEEDFLKGIDINKKLGVNILLGNSSSFENNHIEAIDILSNINLQNKKVITPLSYGDMKLKDYIVNYGRERLDSNFHPLVNFMPKEKYHNIMQTCGYVIMNHKRQQGLATIITELFLGVKLFFNKNNPTYNYFKKMGAYVYLIDEIIETKNKAFTPLTQKQILKNREVLIKTRGKKVVDSFIQEIVEL